MGVVVKNMMKAFFNGLTFGITETVPGVSASTIAIILGFYYKIIESVNHFRQNVRKYMAYLGPFFVGMMVGVVVFSSIIDYFIKNHSLPTIMFFIGLIVGITPVFMKRIKKTREKLGVKDIILIIIPVAFMVTLAYFKNYIVIVTDPAEVISGMTVSYMVFLFFSGVLAAAVLMIPAVSGSFVLLLLGVYPLAMHTVSSLRMLLIDYTNITLWLDIIKVMGPLGIGMVIGALSMARLVEKLLARYYRTVFTVLLGLLIGSVYVLLNDPITYQSGVDTWALVSAAATFALGCVFAYQLGIRQKI